jgi:hypothetical protein
MPVPVAARSAAGTVFDRSNTGIAGSNPTRGTDVCPRFSVLCSPMWVEALRRADSPLQGVLPNVNRFMNSESEQAMRPSP